MNIRLPFFDSFYSENPHRHRRIALDLHLVFFIHGLRWLEVRRLDARQILLPRRKTSVAVQGNHRVRQQCFQRFGVLDLQRVVPCRFQGQYSPAFARGVILITHLSDDLSLPYPHPHGQWSPYELED